MKMKMKNRKGSTLVLTLIVFAVLMIFATFLLGFMVTENKQAMYHQNKTQAYYIARGGAEVVESAILNILRDDNKISKNKLIESIGPEPQEVDLDISIASNEENHVSIWKDNENSIITIKSTAKVNKVNQTVEKVIPINVIPTEEDLILDGSNFIAMDWATQNLHDKFTVKIVPDDEKYKYPIYDFEYSDLLYDQIPPVDNRETLSGNVWGKAGVAESNYFVDNLTISNDVTIINKVNVFVKGYVNILNNANINARGKSENLNIYIYGDEQINSNSFIINDGGSAFRNIIANFYIYKGDSNLYIKKTTISGAIISNGDNMILNSDDSGKDNIFLKGYIYAPKTNIKFRTKKHFAMTLIGYIVGETLEHEHRKIANQFYTQQIGDGGISVPVKVPGIPIVEAIDGYYR